MSLVNQMLQDLEQRRTAEAGVSPLGGLSASGVGVSASQPVNYLLLGTILALVFAVVFALMYLFGLRSPVMAAPEATEPVAKLTTQPIATPIVEPMVQRPVVQQPMVQQPVEARAEQSTVTSSVQMAISPKAQVKANVKASEKIKSHNSEIKMVQPAPVTLPVVNDAAGDEGSVSIVESTSVNSAARVPAVSAQAKDKEEQENLSGSDSVNKTIRPLTSEQQAQIAFQDAVKLIGRGDESGAQRALEQALSFEPNHVRARETLSAMLLNTGRVSEAGDSLREGLRLQPTSTPLAKLYARVLVNQGDNAAAVVVLERAAPRVGDDPDYYALLAALYRGVGKHAQAAQVYQEILRLRPGVAAWWMGLALAQDAMGSSAESLEAYRRAQRAGGLRGEVLQYVQTRIAALTSVEAKPVSKPDVADDTNGFGD
jgi:MSHA biogenesis protein MshN